MFAMTASTFVTRMARVGESEPTAIRDAWMRPAMVAAHAPREERMAKKEGPLTVAFAQYPDPDSAKDALQTLQQMEKEGAIDVVDAGVTEKQSDGKAKISDVQKHARRMNVGEGAIIGGVASLLFPPGIIAGAIVGGVAGEVVGRLRHHEAFKSKEMKLAADRMPPGSSAIVAIIENKWLAELETATEGYESLITQSVDADAAASVTELVGASRN
jgi:uncharacterized membrane protein